MISKYGDRPAFPKTGSYNENQSAEFDSRNQDGMTLREYYAGLAMQAIIEKSYIKGDPAIAISNEQVSVVAIDALDYADALIEQLDREDE